MKSKKLINILKNILNKLLSGFNLRIISETTIIDLTTTNINTKFEPCLEDEFIEINSKINKIFGENEFISGYTVYKLCDFISKNNIKGDLVECGVWKGRQIGFMLETLSRRNDFSRNIYLYDTFEGMTDGQEMDFQVIKSTKDKKFTMDKGYMYYDLNKVIKNLESFNYPKNKIHFKKGDVKLTLNKNDLPKSISLLRLDTDFYDSSLFELEKLYDLVSMNGFIIYDDYGHWMGQHKATNDYYNKNNISPFLIRTSRKERVEVKILSNI